MVYSINKRADQDSVFLAHEIGQLVDQQVRAKAIAGHISQGFSTSRPAVDFPLLTTPVTTSFIAELDALPLSNAGTSHVTSTAYKVAGATQASTEMLNDLNPEIASLIGASIANQIVWSLDTAVLGNTTTNGPSGLLSLASTLVDPGVSLTNLDPFIKAIYTAKYSTVPANISHFIVSPATAEALSKLKTGTGFNQNLLDFQVDGTVLVAGVPILVSSLVDGVTTAWAVDATQQRLVVREGTQVTKTYIPQTDSWFIGGTARYGWVSLNPAAVIRIKH